MPFFFAAQGLEISQFSVILLIAYSQYFVGLGRSWPKQQTKMKKIGNQIVVALAALLSSAYAHAEGKEFSPFDYTTLGVWANSPMGASARVGLAIPTGDKVAVTIGNEFGLHGSKQFVGYRAAYVGHGVGWGGIDVAHWKTRSHPWLADDHTEYYGVEAQLIIFRAGLMFPKGDGRHPKLSLGVGLGY